MKTWTAGELIETLSTLPPTTRVYLEDADTSWIIDKFDIHTGHLEAGAVVDGTKSFLLRPSDYSNISSSLEFEIDRQ